MTTEAKYDLPADQVKWVNFAAVSAQDANSSSAVIEAFAQDKLFLAVAAAQTKSIIDRDNEDGEKLAVGIQLAIAKNVIPATVVVEETAKIDVLGKPPHVVCDEILALLGEAVHKGCVVVLQGLSGTGKGTTVAMLKSMLPRTVTWSNGNVFRSLTLLAVTYAEQNQKTLTEVLTPELLDTFVKMLTFGKFNGKFDVKIEGLGMTAYVSEIENTILKEGRIGKNIPTVAEVTQGEVINFIQGVLKTIAADGITVLVEGREQTLNYIRTPHRFELMLSDEQIIGKRRAAQMMVAAAHKSLTSNNTVMQHLCQSLVNLK